MRVYIVDYLGDHCGMHYYLDSFKHLLKVSNGVDVEVLSNYNDSRNEVFFKNQYEGSFINKICSLVDNYFKFKSFVRNHKSDCIIFLSYGNYIEIPFFKELSSVNKHLIDIHEVIAQHVDKNHVIYALLRICYRKYIRNVIVHSERSQEFLKSFGYAGEKIFVPHVTYSINKNITTILNDDVKGAISHSKKNILFFGNLNYDKGVDLLISAINELDDKITATLNIIIAGKNFDNSVYKVKPRNKDAFNFIIRHIEDDELIYLYKNVDFIAMPYRKTSQSGVLEMAFYFKKPVIATNVPYFKDMLRRFPSFGVIQEDNNESYSLVINRAICNPHDYYCEKDYIQYMNRPEFLEFTELFKKWLIK